VLMLHTGLEKIQITLIYVEEKVIEKAVIFS